MQFALSQSSSPRTALADTKMLALNASSGCELCWMTNVASSVSKNMIACLSLKTLEISHPLSPRAPFQSYRQAVRKAFA